MTPSRTTVCLPLTTIPRAGGRRWKSPMKRSCANGRAWVDGSTNHVMMFVRNVLYLALQKTGIRIIGMRVSCCMALGWNRLKNGVLLRRSFKRPWCKSLSHRACYNVIKNCKPKLNVKNVRVSLSVVHRLFCVGWWLYSAWQHS